MNIHDLHNVKNTAITYLLQLQNQQIDLMCLSLDWADIKINKLHHTLKHFSSQIYMLLLFVKR